MNIQIPDFAMIDLETLALHVNASIIQIGVTVYLGEDKYITAKVEIQPDWGRSDEGTLNWWGHQPHWLELKEAAQNGAKDLDEANEMLLYRLGATTTFNQRYLEDLTWWCKGPHFDIAMLEHQIGQDEVIWDYNKVRDVRTLTAQVLEIGFTWDDIWAEVGGKPSGQSHDAGHDSLVQAKEVVACKRLLYRVKAESDLYQRSKVPSRNTEVVSKEEQAKRDEAHYIG